MNPLEQLKHMTTVVADSGDIDAIRRLQPRDATTNPSLILQAAAQPQYRHLLSIAKTAYPADINAACEQVTVNVGVEILRHIPGRVSTEIDAHLSFDTSASVDSALRIIERYQAAGIAPQRVLIKLAATWQGIQAAAQLEKQGIHCNLTLLFSLAQAKACADAGVTLISPFVGRILDWYKASTGLDYSAETDPGVLSVREIYRFYKQHGFATVVMGASFRNTGEVLALAGCDRLTISPALLAELSQMQGELTVHLQDNAERSSAPAQLTESQFRWALNEDAMATEKLAEGIRKFAIDQRKLEQLIQQAL